MLMLVFAATRLSAMDIQEEQVHPENKLQLIARNQNITTAQYAKLLTQFPKLQELNVSGHVMEYIPEHAPATCLVKLDLSKGKLTNANTLYLLLAQSPYLEECSIAHNQLTTLQETILPLPSHNNLTKLDCSYNRITALDFTELRKRVPNLAELNMAHCPLITCKTTDPNMLIETKCTPTKIDLTQTQLSDTVKIEIIKNSKMNGLNELPTILSGICGGATGVVTLVPTILAPAMAAGSLPIGLYILGIFGTILIPAGIGAGVGQLLEVGFTAPEKREKIVFVPIFDTTPTHTEEEVTTRYQRFVRHFPDWRCWKPKGEEEALLKNIASE
jgi:hypothetical protein